MSSSPRNNPWISKDEGTYPRGLVSRQAARPRGPVQAMPAVEGPILLEETTPIPFLLRLIFELILMSGWMKLPVMVKVSLDCHCCHC